MVCVQGVVNPEGNQSAEPDPEDRNQNVREHGLPDRGWVPGTGGNGGSVQCHNTDNAKDGSVQCHNTDNAKGGSVQCRKH